MPNEVFLSHSSRDRPFVRKLVDVLRRHGIPVWYGETNVQGAQQWHDGNGAALRHSDWFVLLLSPCAVESKWAERELLYSLRQDRFAGRIAPLMYRRRSRDDLSWTLSQMQMVDFTGGFDDGCRDLLRIRGVGYAPAPRSR